MNLFYFPTAKLAMGSLAQNSSGAIRCSYNTRFRKEKVPEKVPEGSRGFRSLPVQIANEVPEGSRGFRSLPAQIANEVPEGSRGFRSLPVQIANEGPNGSVQIARKVGEGSGADG